MNELSNQLLLQMVSDTLRVVMVLYGLCIIIAVGEGVKKLLELLVKLIFKCCSASWKLVRKVFNRPEVEAVEETSMEV